MWPCGRVKQALSYWQGSKNMEQRVWEGREDGRDRKRKHQGHCSNRNTSSCLSNGWNPVWAEGSLCGSELWKMGLHLQLCQDFPGSPGSPTTRQGSCRHESTLHEKLFWAPHQDLPQAWCACHGRHGMYFLYILWEFHGCGLLNYLIENKFFKGLSFIKFLDKHTLVVSPNASRWQGLIIFVYIFWHVQRLY